MQEGNCRGVSARAGATLASSRACLSLPLLVLFTDDCRRPSSHGRHPQRYWFIRPEQPSSKGRGLTPEHAAW